MIEREVIHHCRYSVYHPQKGGVENFGLNLQHIFKKVTFTLPKDVTPHLIDRVVKDRIPVICDYHSVTDWPKTVKTIGFQHGCAQLRYEVTGEKGLSLIAKEQFLASTRRNVVWVADSKWVSDMCTLYYDRPADYVIYHSLADHFFENARKTQSIPVQKIFHDARHPHKGRDLIPVLEKQFDKCQFIQLNCAHSDIIPTLSQCDIFIHLSKYEGNSIMCNEVMALNIPLFATGVGLFHENLGINEIAIIPVEEAFSSSPSKLIERLADYIARINLKKIDVKQINQWHKRFATNAHNETLWQKVVDDHFQKPAKQNHQVKRRSTSPPFRHVLISHHWAPQNIPANRFGQNWHIITHDRHKLPNDPNIIPVKFGQAFDVAELVKNKLNRIEPDLFIAKVDAFFNQIPVNLDALSCPKVLIIGDTQHGQMPLQQLIKYAKKEKYDVLISDHKRHHLWYFGLANFTNLYWLPGLFLNPFDQLYPSKTESIHSQDHLINKTVFIGQKGAFHPRRNRILKILAHRFKEDFFSDSYPLKESLAAYNAARMSLNISLNGDLNLRVFEILSANGCLVTDHLSPASGIDLLLVPEEDYIRYSTIDELVTKLSYYNKNLDLLVQIRRNGHEKYKIDLAPDIMAQRFFDLVAGKNIDRRFEYRPDHRLVFQSQAQHQFSWARIALYEKVQELHRLNERVDILLDGNGFIDSITDFLDLPRLRLTIYNYKKEHVDLIQPYLHATNQMHRVRFGHLSHVTGLFDVLVSQHFDLELTQFFKKDGQWFCSDQGGYDLLSGLFNFKWDWHFHSKDDSEIFMLTKEQVEKVLPISEPIRL